ncbi:MAG: CDP-alcohol phosphatidyltransferase family protein [Nitriliruptoraceae bacterium]
MRLFDSGTRDGSELVTNRILTIPNVISALRLLGLPWIYLELVRHRFWIALLLVAVFSATDWIDGYLARRLRQVTRLGQLLDPVADRALFIVVGIGTVVAGILAWWVILLIVVRDLAMLLIGGVVLQSRRGLPAVTRMGKAATALLMTAFPVVIGAHAVGSATQPELVLATLGMTGLAVGIVLYWVVAIDYLRTILTQDDAHDPANS